MSLLNYLFDNTCREQQDREDPELCSRQEERAHVGRTA